MDNFHYGEVSQIKNRWLHLDHRWTMGKTPISETHFDRLMMELHFFQ